MVWLVLLMVLPQRWVLPGVGAAGRPSVVFGLGLLAWYLASHVYPRSEPLPRRWVTGGVLAYLTAVLLSHALSFNRPLANHELTAGERELLVTLSMVGVALIASVGLPNRAAVDRVLRLFTILVAATALVAMLQFYVGFDLPARIRPPLLEINGGELVRSRERGSFARATGLTDHAIELGVLLAMSLPLALHQFLHASDRRLRQLSTVVVVVIAAAIPLSVSRSGAVGLAVGLLVLAVVWNLRQQVMFACAAVALLFVVRASAPSLIGTIRSLFVGLEDDTSISARTGDYEVAWAYAARHPWFGRGAGTFGSDTFRLLDNQMLKSLIEIGRVGIAAIVAMFAIAMVAARAIRTRATTDETRHLGQTLLAMLAVAFVSLFFADLFFYGMFTGAVFLTIGVVGAMTRLRAEGADTSAQADAPTHPVLMPRLRVPQRVLDRDP